MLKCKKNGNPGPVCAGVEYHSDDYGMFVQQSKRILLCHEQGLLNGVSVMPNFPDLPKCMELLRPVRSGVAVTVHLNLIEGCCLSKPMADVTAPDGTLQMSFGKLLLRSFLPGRGPLRQWLKEEIRAQIRAVSRFLPEGEGLRLDGHAHYHMIPVVFDAMMDVIREEQLPVSYIRIPREYPMLYLKHIHKFQNFLPVNLAKVLILNLLARRNEKKYAVELEPMEKKVFLGVFLSGRMFRENVGLVLPEAQALAETLGYGLEILAHPGIVEEPEDIAMLTNQEDLAFMTDPFRRREAGLFTQDLKEGNG